MNWSTDILPGLFLVQLSKMYLITCSESRNPICVNAIEGLAIKTGLNAKINVYPVIIPTLQYCQTGPCRIYGKRSTTG